MSKNYYNIDEISQIIGEHKHTIRFWESRISKLKVLRTHSGHRLYDYENLLLLKKIKQLISSNEQVLNLSNLKILPIGSNQYLALINLDYRDSLKDEEIITVNSSLINSIKNSEPSISEIYFNPQ